MFGIRQNQGGLRKKSQPTGPFDGSPVTNLGGDITKGNFQSALARVLRDEQRAKAAEEGRPSELRADQPSLGNELCVPQRMRSGEGNPITHTEAFVPSTLNKSFAHGAHGVTIQGCDSVVGSAARAVLEQPLQCRPHLQGMHVVANSTSCSSNYFKGSTQKVIWCTAVYMFSIRLWVSVSLSLCLSVCVQVKIATCLSLDVNLCTSPQDKARKLYLHTAICAHGNVQFTMETQKEAMEACLQKTAAKISSLSCQVVRNIRFVLFRYTSCSHRHHSALKLYSYAAKRKTTRDSLQVTVKSDKQNVIVSAKF